MDNKQDQFAENGRISDLAYDAPGINPDPNVEKRLPKGYSLMDQGSNAATGFNGATFYNGDTNTLVVGIGGTNSANPLDILQDYGVMGGGATAQVLDAADLTMNSLKKLAAQGITDPNFFDTTVPKATAVETSGTRFH